MTRVEAVRKRLRRSTRLELLEQRLGRSEARIKRHGARIKRHGARIKRQGARIKRHGARITSLDERLRRQRVLLDEARRAANRSRVLYEILGAQVGSIEERLQALTEKVEPGRYDATDDQQAEARLLIDEIRDEHRRIRVRFGIITSYEERIRRLESALAEEMAAAAELAEAAALKGAVADSPTDGAVDIPEP